MVNEGRPAATRRSVKARGFGISNSQNPGRLPRAIPFWAVGPDSI